MLTHGLRVRVRHGELFYPRQSTLTSVCHSSLIRRVYGTLICDMSLWHYGDGGISEGSTAEGDGSELEHFTALMRGEGGQKSIETGKNEDNSWNERPSQGIIVSTGRACGRKKVHLGNLGYRLKARERSRAVRRRRPAASTGAYAEST